MVSVPAALRRGAQRRGRRRARADRELGRGRGHRHPGRAGHRRAADDLPRGAAADRVRAAGAAGHRAVGREDGDRAPGRAAAGAPLAGARTCRTRVWESAASNADGARLVQEGRYDGAFAGEFAARDATGWSRWSPRSTTRSNAETRFVLVGRPGAARGADRGGQDLGGDLAGRRPPRRAAGAAPGVRGARGQPDADRVAADRRRASGQYCFSVDAEGHITDRRVGEALMGLKRICPKVRFLGSYPRADEVASAGAARARRTRSSPRRRTGWPAPSTAASDDQHRAPAGHRPNMLPDRLWVSTEVIHRLCPQLGDKST